MSVSRLIIFLGLCCVVLGVCGFFAVLPVPGIPAIVLGVLLIILGIFLGDGTGRGWRL